MSARIFFDPGLSMIFFCCRGRVNFSLPIQLVQAYVSQNTTPVKFAQNTIGDLDGKLFEWQRIRKLPRSYKRYYWPALVKNKNIAQCRLQNNHSCAKIFGEVCPQILVGSSLWPMSAIVFLFNLWIIFRWCRLRNVRLASSGDAFWEISTGNFSCPMSARIFSDTSLSRIFFYLRGWLYFSLPVQLALANVGQNTTSIEFAWNTIADLDGKTFEDIEQENFLDRIKNIIGRRWWKKPLQCWRENNNSWDIFSKICSFEKIRQFVLLKG